MWVEVEKRHSRSPQHLTVDAVMSAEYLLLLIFCHSGYSRYCRRRIFPYSYRDVVSKLNRYADRRKGALARQSVADHYCVITFG